jgi:hypothetical protein
MVICMGYSDKELNSIWNFNISLTFQWWLGIEAADEHHMRMMNIVSH